MTSRRRTSGAKCLVGFRAGTSVNESDTALHRGGIVQARHNERSQALRRARATRALAMLLVGVLAACVDSGTPPEPGDPVRPSGSPESPIPATPPLPGL